MSYQRAFSTRQTSPFGLRGGGGRRPAPTSVTGLPQGSGAVGTASNPSPALPGQTTGLKPAYRQTPNSGGIATGNGRQIIEPQDPGYDGPEPGEPTGVDTPQAWRGPVRPGASPQNRPAQTERANPLTNGGGPPQVEGTSAPVMPPGPPPVDPGRAMGMSARGNKVPAGQDLTARPSPSPTAASPADSVDDDRVPGDPNSPGGQLAPQPGDGSQDGGLTGVRQSVDNDMTNAAQSTQQHLGGFGQYQKSFSNPTSAGIYHSYVKSLFGSGTPAPSMLTRTGPKDEPTDGEEAA